MLKNIVFFDVETNGKVGSSVLSMSAIKVNYDKELKKWTKVGEYDRFYYRNPGEEINFGAINVNGLTDEAIEVKRSNNEYPLHFKDDISSFYSFCEDACHYVAHNIKFDRSFVPFVLKNQFDTMMENIEIVKAGINEYYGTYKWPKLNECAKFYNIPFDEENLHESLYDVLITFRVFYKMSKHPVAKNKILKFIEKD